MAEAAAHHAKQYFGHQLTVPMCPGEVVFLKGLPGRSTSEDIYHLFSSVPSLRVAHVLKGGHQACYGILVFGEAADADSLVQKVDGCVLEYEGLVHCDRLLTVTRPTSFKDLTQVDSDTVLRELFSEGVSLAAPLLQPKRLRVWRRSGSDLQRHDVPWDGYQAAGVEPQPQRGLAAEPQDVQGTVGSLAGDGSAADLAHMLCDLMPEAASRTAAAHRPEPLASSTAGPAQDADEPAAYAPAAASHAAATSGGAAAAGEEASFARREVIMASRGERRSRGRRSRTGSSSASASSRPASDAGTPTAELLSAGVSTASLRSGVSEDEGGATGEAEAVRSRRGGGALPNGHASTAGKENVEDPGKRSFDPACQLYVSNLPYRTTEDSLWELFSQYGKLCSAKVPLGYNGSCRGYGFITFSSAGEAQAALAALNQHDVEGRAIRVVPARTRADILASKATAGRGQRPAART